MKVLNNIKSIQIEFARTQIQIYLILTEEKKPIQDNGAAYIHDHRYIEFYN